MRYFVYKTLFIIFSLFIFYKLTVGSFVSKIETTITNQLSDGKFEKYKDKIRENLRSTLKKDRILYKEDAELLGDLINKILKEINEVKKIN